MVHLTAIFQGVNLVIAISCLLLNTADAAPTSSSSSAGSSKSALGNVTAQAAADVSFLPPLIPDRIVPPKLPTSLHFDVESNNIARNMEWYNEHGGQLNMTKRDRAEDYVGGMTMEAPADAPPLSSTQSVKVASSSQIKGFTKYAAIAATAYCRSVIPGTDWTCKQCLKYIPDGKIIKTFTSLVYDTNGFIVRSDKEKTIYLAFRGTNSFKSMIADLKFDFTTYPNVKGAKVHNGFLKSYNEVIGSYFPVMHDQLTAFPAYKVIITGHSLGAAQALLAGMDLYQRDARLSSKNMQIFTFGSPRVGNPAFAYYVDSTKIPYTRVVQGRDIVAHLPPQSFGYLHPGVEAWIKRPSQTLICDSKGKESSICSNSIVPFTSFKDHSNYYGADDGNCT